MSKILSLLFVTSLCFSQNEGAKTISEKIKAADQSRFDSIAKSLKYKEGDQIKVDVLFTINENGDIVDIRARSVHPEFENEAIRVVKELPKMVPAEYNGKRISQKYALPLVFEIETDKEKTKRLRKEKMKALKQNNKDNL
ncbi:MAG: energy transducer TonB [Confluentibacter sp.]|nr:energy transducer TonB [Confluentibacter sp.]HMR16691.1 energy transducer TonB [Mariniflexile sp.]